MQMLLLRGNVDLVEELSPFPASFPALCPANPFTAQSPERIFLTLSTSALLHLQGSISLFNLNGALPYLLGVPSVAPTKLSVFLELLKIRSHVGNTGSCDS